MASFLIINTKYKVSSFLSPLDSEVWTLAPVPDSPQVVPLKVSRIQGPMEKYTNQSFRYVEPSRYQWHDFHLPFLLARWFRSFMLASLIGFSCVLDFFQVTKQKPRPQNLLLLSQPRPRNAYSTGHRLTKTPVFPSWGKPWNKKYHQKNRERSYGQGQSPTWKPSIER